MPRNSKTAAGSGKADLLQLSMEMLEELEPGPVTKEQSEHIFQNFKKAFIERALNAETSLIKNPFAVPWFERLTAFHLVSALSFFSRVRLGYNYSISV